MSFNTGIFSISVYRTSLVPRCTVPTVSGSSYSHNYVIRLRFDLVCACVYKYDYFDQRQLTHIEDGSTF